VLDLTVPRLDDEFIKVIVASLNRGESLYCRDICNKCVGFCKCEHRDKLARQALIECFIPIAKNVVGRVSDGRVGYSDELLGWALLALTETVDGLTDDIENIPGYVAVAVKFKTLDYVINDHLIKVPREALKHLSHLRDVYELDSCEDSVHGSFCSSWGRGEVSKIIELQETINKVIEKPREKQILQHLMAGGYTNNDIGKMLRVSAPMVCKIKQNICDAFAEELL